MEITTQSYFWTVLLASLGGLVVAVAIAFEIWAEKTWYANAKSKHRWENIKKYAEWTVVFGIVFESIVAGYAARREWKNDPWNGKISEISAKMFFDVKGDDVPDLPIWGSQSRVASMILCENNLEANPGSTTFTPLSAEHFIRSGFVMIGNDRTPKRGYGLTFQTDGQEAFGIVPPKPVKEIDKVKILRIDLKFIPKNADVLGGKVIVVLNGQIEKDFQIIPQIDTNMIDRAYVVFATNCDQTGGN